MKRFWKCTSAVLLSMAMAVSGVSVTENNMNTVSAAASDEIMLGVFWTSDEDCTDTLYWSTNGVDFYELAQAYVDSAPNDSNSAIIAGIPEGRNDNTLHDPSILYRDGYFWMLSGYTQGEGDAQRFIPMLGYSDDLVHWSYPASGSSTNVKPSVTPPGYKEKGKNAWNAVAPDFMVDDDGTVYIVVSLGYYAMFNEDNSANDVMQPYLIKVSNLQLRPEADTVNNPAAPPIAEYEDAVPINLPCMTERAGVAHNHIDGSLYKEDGYYYLSIKENGVTNEIYRINDLSRCSDASAWEEVSYDVATGYEGPCLTKYQGEYFFYMDRLKSYTPVDSNQEFGTNETWVVKASVDTTGKLDKYTGWLEKNIQRIKTYDLNGNERANRHGTVITVTGEAAEKVRNLAKTKGYTDAQLKNTYLAPSEEKSPWTDTGWYYKESYRTPKLGGSVVKYWYEKDVRQGVDFSNPDYRGKEIWDPDSDAWYWLDAVYDGKMAAAQNVYDENGNWVKSAYDNGDYQVAQPVDQALFNEIGAAAYGTADSSWKWVRYDWEGKMIKCNDSDARFYKDGANGNWYRYDPVTGAMQKGLWSYVNDDGYTVYCYFDTTTGVRVENQTIEVNGYSYTFDQWGSLLTERSGPIDRLPVIEYKSPGLGGSDSGSTSDTEYAGYQDPAASSDWNGWHEVNGVTYWYENGLRQGYNPDNEAYRGKEIYDGTTDAWYWLDNVQQGAVAKNKDVYQESLAGEWGEAVNADGERIGKWVRYDENGQMVKGWSEKDGNRYFFDYTYGTMAKGTVIIDGVTCYFDETTGILK